jgi:hypothetical protein
MTDVPLSAGGPPETVLPPEPEEARAALERAISEPLERRRAAVSDVVERWPMSLDAWSRLGELARDDVEAYAYFRVGYHRGLDRLRQSGWRGSGYVRWRNERKRRAAPSSCANSIPTGIAAQPATSSFGRFAKSGF